MSENAPGSDDKLNSSESKILIEDEIDNGKNKHLVKCQFCPSRILNPGLGIYSENKVSLRRHPNLWVNINQQNVFDLPMMTRKKSNKEEGEVIQYETLKYFWQINDMYTFENICFSNTVDNIKYLACADCEIGPVGYYNMDTKISYVALARVNHVN